MNDDSIRLLKEVNSGCKNATDSIGQVKDFVKDSKFKTLLDDYNKEHVKIGDECHQLLNENGKNEKDPPAIAKAMMWFTTEMKMLVDDGDSKVADLLADGCNMGIKSINKYVNQYKKADQESVSLAGRLIRLETDMYQKMMKFI